MSLTGLRRSEFEELHDNLLLHLVEHVRERLALAIRKPAKGGRCYSLLAYTNDIVTGDYLIARVPN